MKTVLSLILIASATHCQPVPGATCSKPSFAAGRTFAAGDSSFFSAVADFNGDHNQDLAVVSFSESRVYILLGNGDSTFKAPVSYDTSPNHIRHGGRFQWRRQAGLGRRERIGPGRFGAAGQRGWHVPKSVQGFGLQGSTVAVGDFNGDRKLDMVVSGPGFIGVLIGAGDGSFQFMEYSFPDISGPAVTGADFNGDGKLDVAVVNFLQNDIAVLFGKGDGTFQNPVHFPLSAAPGWLVSADFNGDGKPDLATGNGDGTVSILLNDGKGGFGSPATYDAKGAATLVVGDFNGDGKLDIAAASGGATFSVLLGNGNGTFQNAVIYTPIAQPFPAIAAGDFNNDGKPDLVVTSPSVGLPVAVTVVLGSGDGTFQAAPGYTTGNSPQSVAIGDFNGDSIPDLAVGNFGDNNVAILLGSGGGAFQPAVTYGVGGSPQSVAVRDLNGDGKLDLAVANLGSSIVSVLLGNGDGTFQPANNLSGIFGGSSVAVGDFNKDGNPDLAVVTIIGVAVYLGKGDGTFGAPVSYGTENGTRTGPGILAVGDVNGDGNADLVIANDSSNFISVLLGNGDGTFKANVDYPSGGLAKSVALGDLNGDGALDMVIANFGPPTGAGGTVSVSLANGDGTFKAPVSYPVGKNAQFAAVNDVNGDGKPDVIAVNFLPWTVQVLLGAGDGTLQSPFAFGVQNGPYFAAVGDLDGDGMPDLVVPNFASSDVSVLLNSCVK